MVRGRGRALPPNLLAVHNYHSLAARPDKEKNYHREASHDNYHKEVVSQNHHKEVQTFPFFFNSQADDKEHFSGNLHFKHSSHKNDTFLSKLGPFSLALPNFFEPHMEPQSLDTSSRFQWSPMISRSPKRRWDEREEWENEKTSWTEGRRGDADVDKPPFGDILERFGRRQRVKEERSGRLRGGWKPVSEGWSTTPPIWTNEVDNCDHNNTKYSTISGGQPSDNDRQL